MSENVPNGISEELTTMAEADQVMRNRAMQGGSWDASVDAGNTERLKAIVDKYGWPTISKVGAEASHSAWTIVQHADHDVEFQATCLKRMKKSGIEEVDPINVAYLEDRVRVNQGRPQLYGTQFFGIGINLKPRPIQDKSQLDERRAKIGLGSFADYRKQIEAIDRSTKR